jgi:hypothetical protein
VSDGLFNSFCREHRPLSSHLWQLAHHLIGRVQAADTLERLAEYQGDRLATRIESVRPTPPRLNGMRAASTRPDGEFRVVSASMRVPTTRHYVAVRIEGDHELLRYWPDQAEQDLSPIDEEVVAALGGFEALSSAAQGDVSDYWRRSQTWMLGTVEDSPAEVSPIWALYTYEDLTIEEERAAAAASSLRHLFLRRRAQIDPIVEQITFQTERFFDLELPEHLKALVAARHAELTDRAAVTASLDFPDRWVYPAPELANVAESPKESAAVDAGELVVTIRPRLSEATFADVQRIIRIWADSIERYPRAFGALDEDPISDLLAATLNATVPGAEREVYTRGGKSDIFIKADTLAEGSGPAKVFICETKWARGQALVTDALENQLFRYLNAHDTSAILLVLCGQKDFSNAQESVLQWVKEAKGFVCDIEGAVAGWPIHQYVVGDRAIDVCIAMVHVPHFEPRK